VPLVSPPLRAALIALALSTVFPLPACSSDDPRPAGPPPDELRYEIHPWTRELSPETLAAVRDLGADDGTVRFAGRPSQLEGLSPGDVLLGGASPTTPQGLLRMVVEISPDAGGTAIMTRPVGIQLAFKSLHARLSTRRTMLDGAPSSGLTPQAKYAVSSGVGGGKVIDWRVFDQDGNRETKDDQLYVHAEVKGALTLTAYIDLDWADDLGRAATELSCALAYPACKPELPDVKMGVRADAEAGYLVDAEGAAATAYDSGEILIDDASFDFPTLTAGPVVIKPTVDFIAEVSGNASTRFHARSALRYAAATEVSVSLKEGPKFIPPTFTRDYDPPKVEAVLKAEVKAAVGPRLSLMFWGTVGPTVSLRGYGKLRADSEKAPCFGLDLGADVKAGVRLRVPWNLFDLEELGELLGLSGDIYKKSFGPFEIFELKDVLSGACGAPPGNVYPPGEGPTDQAYKDAKVTPWSRRYVGWRTAFPFSGEIAEAKLHTDRTVDGAWLVTGKGLRGVLKLSESGDVVWAKTLTLPALDDEVVSDPQARSAVAAQALDTNLWVATSRFTMLKLDQDGDLQWARRYRPADAGLAREIDPVALVPTPDGGALALYALQATPNDGPAVLIRVAADGALLWSRSFAYETAKTFAPVLVADGAEAYVSGFSWDAATIRAHVARLRSDGSVAFARTMGVCDDPRVRPSAGIRLASGALAVVGTYDGAPERSFIAQVAPDGGTGSVGAWWTGDNLKDARANAIAQLPVTGFLTAALGDPIGDQTLQITSHDAAGSIAWQRELTMRDAKGAWSIRPGAVRLTNDGGALVFATVSDPSLDAQGVWVSKLPARTGEGPFAAARVQTQESTPAIADCTLKLGADTFAPAPIPLTSIDVSQSVVVETAAPTVEELMP
jgi:hypothetical protein